MKNKDTSSEFERQAAQMNVAPAFRAEDVLSRLVNAVGGSASARVLDLACGPGIVAEAVAPHVAEVVGIDATPEMVRLAQARFARAGLRNGRFEVGAAEQLPFPNASFDKAITRLSFHHFADIKLVLAEARRVLRTTGHFIVADVISAGDPERSALHNALERLRDPSHVRMLPRAELVELIRGGGFAILSEETWQQERTFPEWAKIVSDSGRTDPLRQVMLSLARAGLEAGIDLREVSGELHFTHSWLLVKARLD